MCLRLGKEIEIGGVQGMVISGWPPAVRTLSELLKKGLWSCFWIVTRLMTHVPEWDIDQVASQGNSMKKHLIKKAYHGYNNYQQNKLF